MIPLPGRFSEVMRPAEVLFNEERTTMEAALAAIKTGKIHACSDLGAAGIGAAVSESARFGGLGARVDLSLAPVKVENLTPEETLICETQARMLFQVSPEDTAEVIAAARAQGAAAAEIGEITAGNEALFFYGEKEIARIPNTPPKELLE